MAGIVESVGGEEAELIVSDHELGSRLSVKLEGMPMDIEAICNASACTTEETVVEDMSLKEIDSVWSGGATFSLLIIVVMLGVFVVLALCACTPYLLSYQFRGKAARGGKEYHLPATPVSHDDNGASMDETEDGNNNNINVNNNDEVIKTHVLEFYNISRMVTLRPDQAKINGGSEKLLVNNVSGSIDSGTLCAIMGPSGAGKSSLLNILAAVDSGDSRISGQILLDGKLQTKGYRKAVAYVQQDDSLYGTLTVKECIEYSAMLRLPRSMTAEEKQEQVWKTIDELHLSHIAHNYIGSSGKVGVSGGERKRVSIGMELVSRATVLMLDEPTSGLDSHAANNLINVLSELSSKNRIVILSIHQPSMKSFLSMDKILLLGAGRVMYDGSPSEVEAYLEDHGFPRPPTESVADHMLDVVSSSGNRLALQGPDVCVQDYQNLVEFIESAQTSSVWNDEESNGRERQNKSCTRERGSVLHEIPILFIRTAKDIFRNRELFLMQLAISVMLALFGGGIFSNVTNDLAGFQNRMGVSCWTITSEICVSHLCLVFL